MRPAAPATVYTAFNILRLSAFAARLSSQRKPGIEGLAPDFRTRSIFVLSSLSCKAQLLVLLTITMLVGAVPAAGQSPKGLIEKAMQLKLLESTRTEVYKRFGEPPSRPGLDHTITYSDDSIKITFLFSTGRCEPGDEVGWDVPESTLVSILFSFDKGLSPKEIPFDWTNFARQKIPDSRDAWEISDQLKGISFVLRTDRKIEYLTFIPGENSRSCHCSNIGRSSKKCVRFVHKDEATINALTVAQKVDEAVLEYTCHKDEVKDSYSDLIFAALRTEGESVFSELAVRFSGHNAGSKEQNELHRDRFFIAVLIAEHLDERVIRLRGTEQGRKTIIALKDAIDRMKSAGSDQKEIETYASRLKSLQGVNITDDIILNTLRSSYNIGLNDENARDFIDFLVSLDPKYPSWSGLEQTDGLRLSDPQKFHRAYLQFRGHIVSAYPQSANGSGGTKDEARKNKSGVRTAILRNLPSIDFRHEFLHKRGVGYLLPPGSIGAYCL